MRRNPYLPGAFFALSMAPMLACAAGQATPDEAKAMAVKAADYRKAVGPDKAFAACDARDNAAWHDRDLYVTVQNDKGVMVAHGTNPGLIGKSVLELRDVDGKAFNQEVQGTGGAGDQGDRLD